MRIRGSLRYGARRVGINAAWLTALILSLSVAMHRDVDAADGARLAVLGDSLTAGYGLAVHEAFPAQLEQRLRALGVEMTVLNAGVSGDTSAGGRARVDWVLGDRPHFAIVELGANDGMRGIDPLEMEVNLAVIIERLKSRGVSVMLAGMYAPPNLGRDYAREFNAVFPRLAERFDVALYPFFLDGVAAEPALNQDDGVHPTAEGVSVIVDRILPHVLDWIAESG